MGIIGICYLLQGIILNRIPEITILQKSILPLVQINAVIFIQPNSVKTALTAANFLLYAGKYIHPGMFGAETPG